MGGFKALTQTVGGVETIYFVPVNTADGLNGLLDSDANISRLEHMVGGMVLDYWWAHASGTGAVIGDIPEDATQIEIDPSIVGGTPAGSFEFPLVDLGGNTSVEIFWDDGTSDVITTVGQAELTHVYPDNSLRSPWVVPSDVSPWVWGFEPLGDIPKYLQTLQAGLATQVQIFDANVANLAGTSQLAIQPSALLNTTRGSYGIHYKKISHSALESRLYDSFEGIPTDSGVSFSYNDSISIIYVFIGGTVYASTPPTPALGVWGFLGFTYDGANIKFYTQNGLYATTPVVGNLNVLSTSTGHIGNLNGNAEYADAQIAQFDIYNQAISDAEMDLLRVNPIYSRDARESSLNDSRNIYSTSFANYTGHTSMELTNQAGTSITTVDNATMAYTGSAQIWDEVP